jgi:NAD(P)-dependent dehydrogenase (short-subunit alcohol dehydrogenase family)
VTDVKSVTAAKEHIEKSEGRLDVLVNNAGTTLSTSTINQKQNSFTTAAGFIDQPQHATNIGISTLRSAFEVNFFGLVQTTTTFLPLLRKSPQAVILNVTSELGSNTLQANWGSRSRVVAYSSTKAAANSYTIALAYELRTEGIKVNCVTPGFTSTKLNLFTPGGKTAKQGAESLLPWALLDDKGPTGNEVHYLFLNHRADSPQGSSLVTLAKNFRGDFEGVQ